MTLKTGRVGNCFWSFNAGQFSAEDHARRIAYMKSFGAAAAPGTTVFNVLHDVPRPSAVERGEMSDAVNAAPSLSHVLGHAFVTNSAVARGALTAINWLIKNRMPEKTFSNPDEGLAWLAKQDPSLDVAAVKAAMLKECPEMAQLKW